MDTYRLISRGASKWPPTRCFQMDTWPLKDSALSVSTFARQFARLRGFPQGATEFSGPEIHTAAGARACADHGRRPTIRPNSTPGVSLAPKCPQFVQIDTVKLTPTRSNHLGLKPFGAVAIWG